jgi:hypothetical protein
MDAHKEYFVNSPRYTHQIEWDNQWTEYTIEKVHHETYDFKGRQHYEITFDGGWSTSCPLPFNEIPPKVGDTVRQYHLLENGKNNIGYPHRGIAINGVIAFYIHPQLYNVKHENWVEDWRRDKETRFEKNRLEYDKRVEALPELFRDRIYFFENKNGKDEFWIEDGGYELFIYEQAVVFAETLGSIEAIEEFHELSYEEQMKRVPQMADGHSGNTFGGAIGFAKWYLNGGSS